VPELYNDSGRLVQLNGNGKLVGVSLVALRELVDKHICGVRVVIRDGVGRKEYFSYQFNSRPHPGPRVRTGRHRTRIEVANPTRKRSMRSYRHELLWRIPKVEPGA
jgi:hypothetical protein